ncbi:MAG: serine protease, partial [Fuerstiella sp.]|nr:serine protease [Fuerstiella sp.]
MAFLNGISGIILAAILLSTQLVWADAPSGTLVERQQRRIETIAEIAPSVVCVMPPNGQGGGSGVLISADGYAISNYHVTSGSGNFMKCGLNDGKLYDAVIVGIDPTGDIALIKLLGRDDFPFCTPGESDHVRAGDEVLALGNPFLLATDFTPTVTYGIVS